MLPSSVKQDFAVHDYARADQNGAGGTWMGGSGSRRSGGLGPQHRQQVRKRGRCEGRYPRPDAGRARARRDHLRPRGRPGRPRGAAQRAAATSTAPLTLSLSCRLSLSQEAGAASRSVGEGAQISAPKRGQASLSSTATFREFGGPGLRVGQVMCVRGVRPQCRVGLPPEQRGTLGLPADNL